MSWEKSVSAFHVVIFLLSSLQPWPSVSNLAKDFIDRVLTVDPSERLTAGQALKHPWIVSMAASSSMKNLQRCISQNLLKRASSRCQSTKSAQSTRSSRSSKSGRARRVREKELRELNRRYQQQYNGWRKKHAVTLHMLVQTLWDPLDMCRWYFIDNIYYRGVFFFFVTVPEFYSKGSLRSSHGSFLVHPNKK